MIHMILHKSSYLGPAFLKDVPMHSTELYKHTDHRAYLCSAFTPYSGFSVVVWLILSFSCSHRNSDPPHTHTIFLDHKHRWSKYTGEGLVNHCHQRITAHFIAPGLGCAYIQII